MTKTYVQPIGLLCGDEARRQIAAGTAGALGGMEHIAFTTIATFTRENPDRVLRTFQSWQEHPAVRAITTKRQAFAGLSMDRTRVMGIVNVTPDSFSDGGKFDEEKSGIRHGKRLDAQGADILDIGGESTRPGSEPVSVEDEITRVLPVVEALSRDHLVSLDTRKSAVMRCGLKAGAKIINDVSALGFDPDSSGVVAQAGASVVLMHAQGDPKTMQLNPRYSNVLLDVYDGLEQRISDALKAGIARDRICVDPGIGFGKTFKQNLQLMAGLSLFHGLGVPVLVGLSRKAFVGAVTGENVAAKRAAGSVGGALAAAMQGVHILRVHDVAETVQGLKMFTASLDPDSVDI